MGAIISRFVKRFFDYPIKRKPICFFRAEQFTSTGEPRETPTADDATTENVAIFARFHNKLQQVRKKNRTSQAASARWDVQEVVQKFPGWNEITVTNLHSLFLLFNNDTNGMLGLNNFCSVLECLGDENPHEVRSIKFEEADTDHDGWINYDVFLQAIYNFNPPNQRGLGSLAKLCYDLGQNIRFITTLSVGEQLEYGLF